MQIPGSFYLKKICRGFGLPAAISLIFCLALVNSCSLNPPRKNDPTVKVGSNAGEEAFSQPLKLTNRGKISPKLEEEKDYGYCTRFIYSYLPEYKNRLPNRRVWVYLFLPKSTNKLPLVFILPNTKGVSRYIELNMGEFFARNGFAFITIETGFQKDHRIFRKFTEKKTGLELALIYLDLIHEYILESQSILDWVKANPAIDSSKICVGGISLGSFASELVLELRPDINCGIFLLGGGNIDAVFLNSAMFKGIREELFKNKDLGNEFLRHIKQLDPLNFAYNLKGKKILMFNALFDALVPREYTLEFAKAAGSPPIKWLIGGHVTSIFSLAFVEVEMLNFLNKNLMPGHSALLSGK